jgi:hypothetical protein
VSHSIPIPSRPAAPFPAAAAGAALGILAFRYAISPPDDTPLREFLVSCAIIAVFTAFLFGRTLPRALAGDRAGRTALTLSLLALLTAPVYWLAFPPVLAIAGVALGTWTNRRSAVAIGVLGLLATVAIVVADALAA